MSEMVYEFREFQGLMGYYYAKALGEGAELPTSVFSAIVVMSIKLDTLFGLL